MQEVGYGIQEVGCRMQGYRTLDVRCRWWDIGCRMQGERILDAG